MKRTLILMMLLHAVLACSASHPEVETFVREYVRSVYEDTELYKRYTPEIDRTGAEIARSNMTADFELIGSDVIWFGDYEFLLRFSNGATGIVAIRESKGEIVSANIIVPPPSKR